MNERFSKFNTGLLADRKITQLMIFTALTFFIFSYVSKDIFFTSSNFVSMAYQIPEIAILSIALTIGGETNHLLCMGSITISLVFFILKSTSL